MANVIDADQWDRQKRIRGWRQDAISSARCIVIGAGALGNEVVKNLLQLGVGEIAIVDHDRVVKANLNRCFFFRHEDCEGEGEFKANAIAREAIRINPDAMVTPLVKKVEELPEGAYSRFDYCFSCLDNLGARLHLNAHAYGACTLIDGGTFGFSGKVQVVRSPSSCLECGVSKRDYSGMWRKYSCTGEEIDFINPKFQALATTTSITSAIQVGEFVKLAIRNYSGEGEESEVNPLTGMALEQKYEGKFATPSKGLVGKYLFFNLLDNSFGTFDVAKR